MIYFLAPDSATFISGGNRFNQQIVSGLMSMGYDVAWTTWVDIEKKKMTATDYLYIDSIYLRNIALGWLLSVQAYKIFVAHLLPSMLDASVDVAEEREQLNAYDHILANSAFTRSYFINRIEWTKKLDIVQPYISPNQALFAHKNNNKIAILISNWLPNKQLDLFLKAVALREISDNFYIYIYGDINMDASYFSQCLSIIHNSPVLSKVIQIKGVFQPDDMQTILDEADVMIDASNFETYGMAVAESIVSGLPVLSLGAGHVEQLMGQGKSMVCKSIDELVDHMILFLQDKMILSLRPIHNIITDWQVFKSQLTPFLE